jgi:hypothetical protein
MSMVEIVARALQRSDFGRGPRGVKEADAAWNEEYEPDPYKESYRSSARAAIAAMREELSDGILGKVEDYWTEEDRWSNGVSAAIVALNAVIDAALAEQASSPEAV